jgi:HAMP domain-containing protein
VTTDDEVGDMAKSFEQMVENLRETIKKSPT